MSGAGEVMDEFEDKHGETGSHLLAQSDYDFQTFLSWLLTSGAQEQFQFTKYHL